MAESYYECMHRFCLLVRCTVLHRASMEGPLWCQVLQLFVSALEGSMSEKDRLTVLPDFLRSVYTSHYYVPLV